MAFHDTSFLLFFVIAYGFYLCARFSRRWQNTVLLIASYVFYGYWDYRFLALLWFITAAHYFLALQLDSPAQKERKRLWVWLSVAVTVGALVVFKYLSFFSESTRDLLLQLGLQPDFATLEIILPLGLSFYSLQSLSFVLDVSRGRASVPKSIVTYATFVSFFPQLIAGPIERAKRLIPQLEKKREISANDIAVGLTLVVLGYFQKAVIADNLSIHSEALFSAEFTRSSLTASFCLLAFFVQIYFDFSGYTDIARGIARMMGIELSHNFLHPYSSRSMTELWKRWHITLSYWFRDYVYRPLRESVWGGGRPYSSLLITMALVGLWHGAGWNFLIWGIYHGVFLVLEQQMRGTYFLRSLERLPAWTGRFYVQLSFALGLVFFGSESLARAVEVFSRLGFFYEAGQSNLTTIYLVLYYAVPAFVFDFVRRTWPKYLGVYLNSPLRQGLALGAVLALVLLMGTYQSADFIYFVF